MSTQPATRPGAAQALAAGVVIALAMIGAFLWGEAHKIDTTPLLAILSPVVGALFLVPKVDELRATTQEVRRNTNGHLSNLSEEAGRLREENAQLREQLASTPAAVSSSDQG